MAMISRMSAIVAVSVFTLVLSASAYAIDLHPVQVMVLSADGLPVPGAAIELVVSSQHWGPYSDHGAPFPTHIGWHTETDISRWLSTHEDGTLLTPEINGGYRDPQMNILISGLMIPGCGSNGTSGPGTFTNPVTRNGIDAAQNCPSQYNAKTSSISCRLTMTRSELEEMRQQWAEACKNHP